MQSGLLWIKKGFCLSRYSEAELNEIGVKVDA